MEDEEAVVEREERERQLKKYKNRYRRAETKEETKELLDEYYYKKEN